MPFVYRVHHLPTSDPALLAFLAGKFAALRLSALAISPAAFSSTFEIESAFTASQWITRLQRPRINFFICVAYPPDTRPEKQTIDAGDWVGSATLLGPHSKQDFELPESGCPDIEDDTVETKWHMTSIYNSPEHRGKGLAQTLINDAVKYSSQQTGAGKQSRMRVFLHPKNLLARGLYVKLGFVDAGLCTLAEAYNSNGESELLPADGGKSDPEKYQTRMGLIMWKVTQTSALDGLVS